MRKRSLRNRLSDSNNPIVLMIATLLVVVFACSIADFVFVRRAVAGDSTAIVNACEPAVP